MDGTAERGTGNREAGRGGMTRRKGATGGGEPGPSALRTVASVHGAPAPPTELSNASVLSYCWPFSRGRI